MGVAIKLPGFRGRRETTQEAPAPARKPTRAAPQKRQQTQDTPRKARKPQARAKGATRKQRAAVTRKGGFGWLNRILILLGVGVVLVAALEAWIYLSNVPVERITVTGELEHTRTEAVQDMVHPALGGGFLWADLGRVQEQLEGLPWIYDASVRRVWPNALEIHVVEQLPIARWGDSGFLNHEGQVFRPSGRGAWDHLPLLTGPEGAAGPLMFTYLRLVDLLTPLGLGVVQLAVDERGQLEAVLAGGQRLMVGGDQFLERMQRFTRLYRLELAPLMDDVVRVDLRYRQGIAVAFREPAAEEQQAATEKA